MFDTVTIVGVGLIGGSFSLALQDKHCARRILGVSKTPKSLQKALDMGLIQEALSLEEAVPQSDLIYVAIPVDVTVPIVRRVMDLMNHNQIVADAGSTKQVLCSELAGHPMRSRLVASHPMWGTEYSGPESAVHGAFDGRVCVICDGARSESRALQAVQDLYGQLGMQVIHMDPESHDIHAAYVSHISHITSFALANTVLEKEKEEDAIFALAGGGFESTVRLAKSNPDMWAPIFIQNRENVLDVLNEHISQLRKFKSCLEKENESYLRELMSKANQISRIIK
jgi:prephenate dehydrogenase